MEFLLGILKKNAIVALIIAALGGYIVYDKYTQKTVSSSTKVGDPSSEATVHNGSEAEATSKSGATNSPVTNSPGAAHVTVNVNPEGTKKSSKQSEHLEEEFQIDPIENICPNRNGGDKEFDGNGPSVKISATLEVRGNSLVAVINFRAKETKSDYTSCTHRLERVLVTIDGDKFDRIEILSGKKSEASYIDTNHDLDSPNVANGNLVEKFEIMGDTGGDDVGNCTDDDTKYSVYFNSVKIKIHRK